MKKVLFSLLVLFVAVFGLTSCNKDKLPDSKTAYTAYNVTKVDVSNVTFVNPGKLTVAVSTDFAPMEFIDLTKTGQDKYTGADIQLAKAMAEAFGLTLEIKSMDFDLTLVALDNGTADIAISGFSYTASRAASYLYTDCYYAEGDGGQVLVVKKSNAESYKTIESLNLAEKKVAAQNGALQQDLVTEFMPNAQLIQIDDLNSAYDMLNAGSIDAVAIAETVAKALIAKSPESFAIVDEAFNYVDGGNFALVKSTNTALATAANAVISQIGNDLFQKWVDEGTALFAGLKDNAAEDISSEEE